MSRNNFNPVFFQIGYDGEFTLREIFFGIGLVSILSIVGVLIYQKIDSWIEENNAKYLSAVWTTDDETFQNRLKTDSRDAFSFGKWYVIDPVTYDDWEKASGKELRKKPTGRYAELRAVKEHWTRHTRVVTYTTTVNGKPVTRTRTETYYTWDVVYSKTVSATKVNFCGVDFSYNTIKPDEDFHSLSDCFWSNGFDRWLVYAKGTEAEGIAFVTFNNGHIENSALIQTEYKNTPNDFQKYLNRNLIGNAPRIIFWVVMSIIMIVGFILFGMAENEWLNN